MTTRSWHSRLSRPQLLGVLSALEVCADAAGGDAFKVALTDAIATHFGVRDVTFFHGPTYPEIFADPAPLLGGATARLLPEYREKWRDKDLFTLPRARRALAGSGFVTMAELARLPGPQRSYVVDYLRPNDMHTAAALHLRLADGEALVGMFDLIRPWSETDLLAIRVLARQLRASTPAIRAGAAAPPADPFAGLTPRQVEVAQLVSDGLSNAEIAAALSLSELSVKKYISRIFGSTGHRNRAELATAVLRAGLRAHRTGR